MSSFEEVYFESESNKSKLARLFDLGLIDENGDPMVDG